MALIGKSIKISYNLPNLMFKLSQHQTTGGQTVWGGFRSNNITVRGDLKTGPWLDNDTSITIPRDIVDVSKDIVIHGENYAGNSSNVTLTKL